MEITMLFIALVVGASLATTLLGMLAFYKLLKVKQTVEKAAIFVFAQLLFAGYFIWFLATNVANPLPLLLVSLCVTVVSLSVGRLRKIGLYMVLLLTTPKAQ